jgi:hypothetical protein
MIKKSRGISALTFVLTTTLFAQQTESQNLKDFESHRDLINLHYDYAPDKDDGHSAAADRTILESLFGASWIQEHVIPVAGTYGTNAKDYNPEFALVMQAVWGNSGWLNAHQNWNASVEDVVKRWSEVLENGGNIWIKEGGQSDFTANVVRLLKTKLPKLKTHERIHVVQHSRWNEEKTTPEKLSYIKKNTLYIKIDDANKYLNIRDGNIDFETAARTHPIYGEGWRAAFSYYNPKSRIDFSDTGELMHILGLGKLSITSFQHRFLSPNSSESKIDKESTKPQ